eukprot:Plantae.Rhodophyta-Purpureofilum_apyrenoidigerum.ctg9419.p1 GENE.Plantae.Rhodophyta-Purpureofilum_apyrenoidigerum.ctg9419~~Plantae.Rhodophyta-Purpureofilum_apyrenoidigerum.ctg9419.p1  ORF type:complete len:534 (+),score=80.29 Plantae.Rhodophyta-Purpureofilum_apyrenoidigerum.ctg9419:1312-2913(+)
MSKLLTSSNLFTNPAAVFERITTGTQEVNVQSVRTETNEGIFSEILRDSASLLESTFFGVMVAAGTIPEIVSKGLAGLSGDTDQDQYFLDYRNSDSEGNKLSRENSASSTGWRPQQSSELPEAQEIANVADTQDNLPAATLVSEFSAYFKTLRAGKSANEAPALAAAMSNLHTVISPSTNGLHMRPRRAFPGRRVAEYDLRSAIGQMLADSVGVHEYVLGWIGLSREQPDDSGLWKMWEIMRTHTYGTRRKKRAPSRDIKQHSTAESKSETQDDDQVCRIVAIVSTSKIVIARISRVLVWSCSLDKIVDLKNSDEEDVLLLQVRSQQGSAKTFWPSIVCGSEGSRQLLSDLIKEVRKMRMWQYDTIVGAVNREGELPDSTGSVKQNDDFTSATLASLYASLRDPDSRRSVKVIFMNKVEESLVLKLCSLKSGIWRRRPPRQIPENESDFLEADGGKALTADVQGRALYVGAETQSELHISFFNLFLAPNSFTAHCTAGYDVQVLEQPGQIGDHVVQIVMASRKVESGDVRANV